MLYIPEELNKLYKQENVYKSLAIYFPALNLTINNDRLVSESFELSEALCSDDETLIIGSCEAAQVVFTVADVDENLKGQVCIITQLVGGYTMPLGTYTVYSCVKQDNRRFKEITAYDIMPKSDIDVASWYNSLAFPVALSSFRSSLLTYLGFEEDPKSLQNDGMIVEKTIDPITLKGRDVLFRIEEASGSFGHISRTGKFKHIVLSTNYGLYPSETLYPSDDLFSEYGMEIVDAPRYRSVKFEDYVVNGIDKLLIRREEGDVGVTVGDGDNAYIIEGNFLLFGKSAEEIQIIANNIFNNIRDVPYREFTSVNSGLPYIELGDPIAYEMINDYLVSYVFRRKLKGIQALIDEYSAAGTEEVKQDFSTNNQIIQLQGKMAVIKKSVESVSVTVSDLAESTEARFEITDQNISSAVSDLDEQLTGEINVLAGQIELKVDAAGVIAAINLSPGSVQISADKINLTGYTKFTDLATAGETIINGSNIKTGTIDAGLVNVVNLNAENITAGTFSGDRINGGSIYGITINGSAITGSTFNRTVNGSVWTAIDDAGFFQNVTGGLSFQVGYYSQTGYIYVDGTSIQMGPSGYALAINDGGVFINGSKPITEGNIATYAAPQGHTHTTLWNGSYLAYLSSSGNFASGNGGNLGAPSARWGMVYLSSSPDVSSDRDAKHDITDLDAVYKRLILQSKPVKYKYNDGTSDRWHTGFISQDYEELLKELGLTTKDFAAFVKSPIYAKHLVNDDGHELPDYDTSSEIIGYAHGLRYEELIAPAVSVMQEQQVLIEELFTRVKLLEGRY